MGARDRYGEVWTSSSPSTRAARVGSALLDAVDAELASRGIRDLMIGVMEGNDEARRLYERRGLVPGWLQLYRVAAPRDEGDALRDPGVASGVRGELMLQRKSIDYKRIDLPQWFHRRSCGAAFPGNTVPALCSTGAGSRARSGSPARSTSCGPIPRSCLSTPTSARRSRPPRHGPTTPCSRSSAGSLGRAAARPRGGRQLPRGRAALIPVALAKPAAPAIIRILARDNGSTDAAVRSDLAALPAMLDQVDRWIADGLIGGAEPNVADFQIATTLALLMTLDDVRPAIEARPAGALAKRVAPGYPGRMPRAFPPDWITVTG